MKDMIATSEDLLVRTEDEFWRLPGDGLWEVAAGRAILLPPNENEHSYIATKLTVLLYIQMQPTGLGHVVATPNVRIPALPDSSGEFWSRVPDVAVSTHKPRRSYSLGYPPELVIEILSSRRGNVERTEKIEDYARAGIGEYWIVNPFDRIVEVYLLRDGAYQLTPRDPHELLRPQSFAGVAIDPRDIWTALD
jgi:Uma2 family endonuclease